MHKPNVLILGGGPAGMAAALELDKAGKSFMIIEKKRESWGIGKNISIRSI